jgi:hypothetical protein
MEEIQMTSEMIIEPMKIIVAGVEWTAPEIVELKNLYSGRAYIELDKVEIRESALLQKALECEVICAITLQVGPTAVLQLARVGYNMFGQV